MRDMGKGVKEVQGGKKIITLLLFDAEDPPKFPLKRGTLRKFFPPLKRGAGGIFSTVSLALAEQQ